MSLRKAPSLPASDGLVELPHGKIAAIATYLEMRAPAARAKPARLPGRLEPLSDDLPRYRALYALVGEPWLWFSRALMSDVRLRSIIEHADVEALALVAEGRDIGMVELDFRTRDACELAFFGLAPEATGHGIGPTLIAEAIRRAFRRPIERLWLHTCTLDHPAALPFYLKAGFVPYRRAIEIADDPRLSGHMPKSAGAAFPIVASRDPMSAPSVIPGPRSGARNP